jgi:hypothetical protein
LEIAEVVIGSIDWPTYTLFDGSAAQFGERLAEFIANEDAARQEALWQNMENHVFAQDDIFSAAEPTIKVLMASLVDERPRHVRLSVLDLLFHLVQAASYRGDDLGQRCLDEARQGAWLLGREAMRGSEFVKDACLEVLDICSPEIGRFVRLAG